MQEPPVRPEPDFPEFPQDRVETSDFLADLATFLGCFFLGGMCLLPLFKLISPNKNEWTITAFFMTSFLVGFALFLLAKIWNKLNHK